MWELAKAFWVMGAIALAFSSLALLDPIGRWIYTGRGDRPSNPRRVSETGSGKRTCR